MRYTGAPVSLQYLIQCGSKQIGGGKPWNSIAHNIQHVHVQYTCLRHCVSTKSVKVVFPARPPPPSSRIQDRRCGSVGFWLSTTVVAWLILEVGAKPNAYPMEYHQAPLCSCGGTHWLLGVVVHPAADGASTASRSPNAPTAIVPSGFLAPTNMYCAVLGTSMLEVDVSWVYVSS